MRKLSILALVTVVLAMVSCQKSSIATSINSSAATDATAKKSNFDLLTAHPWVYYKYYIGYVDSSNKGQIAYRRGSSHNTLDLDSVKETYYPDGTIDEYDGNGV